MRRKPAPCAAAFVWVPVFSAGRHTRLMHVTLLNERDGACIRTVYLALNALLPVESMLRRMIKYRGLG